MRIYVLVLALFLSGCVKTRLVTQTYMPTPPSILMQPPKELGTIKKSPVKEKKKIEESVK